MVAQEETTGGIVSTPSGIPIVEGRVALRAPTAEWLRRLYADMRKGCEETESTTSAHYVSLPTFNEGWSRFGDTSVTVKLASTTDAIGAAAYHRRPYSASTLFKAFDWHRAVNADAARIRASMDLLYVPDNLTHVMVGLGQLLVTAGNTVLYGHKYTRMEVVALCWNQLDDALRMGRI